ncbi:hypothetical protein SRS16CHR_00447 [Variovorax sp. SRS16]|uniref:nuclear transport factor 2 family protein n=1 Tax=Variovorax sp. SRS16 TaxID=282217 RepID=UPI00131685A6|nr:nuclear transport factor 2 family protein [Variovorax sp. SRS16]VTU13207.1 hypothetical protein SRS16CHR_00447 [Variovorax sp. SRS16]
MEKTNDYSPSRLAARSAIQDIEYRWCRAVDRRDYAAIPGLFHADAYDDHGSYRGDIAGLVQWLRKRHESVVLSMHQIANMLIEFVDDDNVLVEAYLTVVQRYAPGAAGALAPKSRPFLGQSHVDLISRSRYIDRLERREGEWKILRRTFVQDWKQILELAHAPEDSPNAISGRRGLDDPVFCERREMGFGD